MDIKLDIDAQKIQELIANKVLESGFGILIDKAIKINLENFSYVWRDTL